MYTCTQARTQNVKLRSCSDHIYSVYISEKDF